MLVDDVYKSSYEKIMFIIDTMMTHCILSSSHIHVRIHVKGIFSKHEYTWFRYDSIYEEAHQVQTGGRYLFIRDIELAYFTASN